MRARRRKFHDLGLTHPPGVILPPPAEDAAAAAVLEIHQQCVRRADSVHGRAARIGRVVELDVHRIVPFRIARGAQAKPDVILRAGGSRERRFDVIVRGGQRRVRRRPPVVGARQHLPARTAGICRDRPVPVHRYVGRVENHVAGRCAISDSSDEQEGKRTHTSDHLTSQTKQHTSP